MQPSALAEARDWLLRADQDLAVTERGPDHWGHYRDRLVRRDGRWLFAERHVRVDGRSPGSRLAAD